MNMNITVRTVYDGLGFDDGAPLYSILKADHVPDGRHMLCKHVFYAYDTTYDAKNTSSFISLQSMLCQC